MQSVNTEFAEQVNDTGSRVLPEVQALQTPVVELQVSQSGVLTEQSLQVWAAVVVSRY